jgi:pyrimidine-nucleoside phosphorylase
VGNINEVVESVQCLKNNGPDDVMQVTKALAVQMLLLGKIARSEDDAESKIDEAFAAGSAFEKFCEFVEAQGGDPDKIPDQQDDFGCKYHRVVKATEDGFVAGIDSYAVGMAGVELGAGRREMGDEIDHNAGIRIHKKVGEQINKGDALLEFYTNKKDTLGSAAEKLERAYTIKGQQVNPPPLIHEIIS